jgi:DHHC palmitoyltransferase
MVFVYGVIPSPSSLIQDPRSKLYSPTLPLVPFGGLSSEDNGYSYLPQYNPTHTTLQVKNDGRARFCQKCSYAKPDRTHHCSICRRCILKMDHHCPWLGNCIGFGNYKAFVLFLVYLSTFCAESCLLSVWSVVYWVKYITPVCPRLRLMWGLMWRMRIIYRCSGCCLLLLQA